MSISLCGFLCEPVKHTHPSAHKWPQLNRNKPHSHYSFQLLWKAITVARSLSLQPAHTDLPKLSASPFTSSESSFLYCHFFHHTATIPTQNYVQWDAVEILVCNFRQVKARNMKMKREKVSGNYSTAPWWWERSFVPWPPQTVVHLQESPSPRFIHSQKKSFCNKTGCCAYVRKRLPAHV